MTSNPNNSLIVPNKSAAGIKLRATKKALFKIWADPIETEQISSIVEKIVFENVEFWLESNKVTQIGVLNLYEGKTKNGICLGSKRVEVEEEYGALSWDGTWNINSFPFGIGFDFEYGLDHQQHVTEIFVFEE